MKPVILHIETSTDVCSVALSHGCSCLSVSENSEDRNHAAVLAHFIDRLLYNAGLTTASLNAVALSAGPGSYTGLRIGVSIAKGLCYGGGIPLIAIPTLRAMSAGFAQMHSLPSNAILCPMLDARRMEVYTALYNACGQLLNDVAAEIITAESFATHLASGPVYFFGSGAAKCRSVITSGNAIFADSFAQSASHIIPLAVEAFHEKKFADTAYFEPFYLKEFMAGRPKNLLNI